MEQTKLTFRADEQCLVKTGGVDKGASKTANYFKAVFDLGANWTEGYDSVKAVWGRGADSYSQILDGENSCYIPNELAFTRGEIQVNLVGSVVEGDVLVERLTTFPILAINITKNARIEGQETQPITASQFDQYVSITNAGASRAEASAEEAEQSALASAQSAQSASDSAESASDSAQSASQSAEEAEQASQSVLGLTATASVDSSVGTPSVAVTVETVGDHKVMDFDFHNLKGETGEQGIQGEKGEQGIQGETGASGADGFSPTVEVTPTTDGHEVTITDKDGEHTFEVLNGTVEDIYPFLPTDTAQGEIASFSDGANDVPVVDLTIAIEPTQSGSGDPSPTNIRPISGWTGAVVQRTGKNLFDKTSGNEVDGYFPGGSTSSIIPSYNHKIIYIECKPNTTYTISNLANNRDAIGYTTEIPADGVAVYNSTDGTVTTGADAKYLVCYCYNANSDTVTYQEVLNAVQIELGTTATAYEPYQGQTYPISWATEAGTVYGGTLDVTTGLLTVDRAMVDLGSLNWRIGWGGFFCDQIRIPTDGSAIGRVICSRYKTTERQYISDYSISAVWGGEGYGSNGFLYVADSTYSDATTFKTAMNGVQCCYELETPITYQLTPTEVRTLLGDNNIWADTGDTEVTYKADIQKYIDKQISAVLNA